MARTATGNVAHACLAIGGLYSSDANLILADQVSTKRILIGKSVAVHCDGTARRWRLVAHIENLIARAKIFAGIAMTAKAPLHLKRSLLIHQRHLVDRTVTGIAADSFIDMNAVIEIDEVGELVDPRPLQRLAGAVAGADGLEQLSVGPDLRVAVHAGFRRRNAGEARGFDRGVAVAAIDPESGNVVLVTERHRLRLAHTGIGNVRRTLDFHRHPGQRGDHKHRAKNCGPGQSIRTAMKNLRHSRA